MLFKDLVDEFKEDHVITRQLFTLYPDQKKSEKGYLNVIHELRKLKPQKNKMSIIIDNVKDEDGDYWSVSGFYKNNPKDNQKYGIEFSRWERWLGMTVDSVSLKQMSMLDFYCHCLWEMTWDGFEQEEIQARIKELDSMVQDVKSGKAKSIPFEK